MVAGVLTTRSVKIMFAMEKNFLSCSDQVTNTGDLPSKPLLAAVAGFNFTTAEGDLVALMQQYWTNFAKTHNPNGANLPRMSLLIALTLT